MSLAALSAASFRDALARAARYKQLTCPEEIQVTTRGRECGVRFRWLRASGSESAVLTDLCFAWIVGPRASRDHRRRPSRSRRVRARRARPARLPGALRLRGAFQGAAQHSRSSAPTIWIVPFETHNTDLLSVLTPQLDAELASRQAEHADTNAGIR